MQGIYNYIPETNHAYKVYGVSAMLYFETVLHVMLFPISPTFCTGTLALPAVWGRSSAQYGYFFLLVVP
jgi:hypothetical protein